MAGEHFNKPNRDRIERVGKAFKTRLVLGEWAQTDCPYCHYGTLSIKLNDPGHIGLRCTEHCSTSLILRVVHLKPTDLKRSPSKPRTSRKAGELEPVGNKTVAVANTLLKGSRPLRDVRAPPPHPFVLKLFVLLAAHHRVHLDNYGVLMPEKLESFTTTAAELSALLKLERHLSYAELGSLLHGCLSFVTLAEDKDRGKVIGVRWFDDSCNVDIGAKTITVRLNDKALPYLGGAYGFDYSRFRSESVLAMRGTYAMLLYMFLVQFARPEWRNKTPGISLSDLHRLLFIPRESAARKVWWRFEQDILRPAFDEIQRHTELRFDHEPIRAGTRKKGAVLAVRFSNIEAVKLPDKDSDLFGWKLQQARTRRRRKKAQPESVPVQTKPARPEYDPETRTTYDPHGDDYA